MGFNDWVEEEGGIVDKLRNPEQYYTSGVRDEAEKYARELVSAIKPDIRAKAEEIARSGGIMAYEAQGLILNWIEKLLP